MYIFLVTWPRKYDSIQILMWRPVRKQYFDIWIDFYVLTWRKKETFKLGYSLEEM